MKRMNGILTLLVAACLLFTVGCTRSGDDQAVAFAVVDGQPLTSSFVRDTVLVSARLKALAGRPISARDFPEWGNDLAMRITPNLLSARLLEREMHRIGLVPSAEDRKKVLATYNRLANTNLNSVTELAPLFGDLAGFFAAQFERDCLFMAYKRTQLDFSVGEDDLNRYYRAKTNALRRAVQIDKDARRKADEAWAKLNAGAKWDDVAKEFSEDALLDDEYSEYYREWGTFRPQDFANDVIGKILPEMKAGDYSKPVESDEGMIIVRVNEKNGDAYECGRILLRMAAPVDVPEPEDARREISRKKSRNAQLKLLGELKAKSKIEYPLGTNFTYQIWKIEEKPKAKMDFKKKGNAK